MFLSPQDLRTLTGYARADKQRRELDAMGIDYLVRSDGKNIVCRSAVGDRPQERRIEPNFESLR